MSDILSEIYNAFEPNVAANSQNYSDCKEARGGGALIKKIKKRLTNTRYEHIRFLFTGHLGCGKSSELKHLAKIIRDETTFLPIYIDFEEYLDRQDVTLEDIFLAMIAEIAKACKEKFEIKSKHESYSLLKKIFDKLPSVTVKGDVGLPFELASISIESLRVNPSLRKQIREAIHKDEKRSLFSELNDFITEIELRLKQETEFTKLVIIADSLEKIKRFERKSGEDHEDEIESQKRLFIDKAEQLTGIATNIIYTVPLSLYRSRYGKHLPDIYSSNVFVLPMVKIHKRGKFDKPYPIGEEELKNVIKKRLEFTNTSIEKAFEKEALDYLIKYSGGHIRTLVRSIQESSISIDELPINLKVAKDSIKEEVRGFAASVREEYWIKLAELELSPHQQIPNGDEDYSKMLEGLAILEYMNGDDVETDDDYWYAVNPAIRRTIKFNEAVEKLKGERAKLNTNI